MLLLSKINKAFTQYLMISIGRRNFHWYPGVYVSLANTIIGFNRILAGELDDIPEAAFYMVGDIDEVLQKAETLAS